MIHREKEIMMLLSKDERKTLLKYYHHLQDTHEYLRFIALSKRTYNSTHNLIKRGLLNVIQGGNELTIAFMVKDYINLNNFLASSEEDIECADITLHLTLDGYDLASKYDSWWYKTGGMWWAEYKGHWFWTIAGIIISFVVGLVIGKLK